MPSRTCPECGTRWPLSGAFAKCPVCEKRTTLSDDHSIPLVQVKQMINALKFERFYMEWDANREGPSPDELGKQDAAQEIARRKEPDAK